MTVLEAIGGVDELKPNAYTQEEKVRWLSEVDARVKTLILDGREGVFAPFYGYDPEWDLGRELLAPAPFDTMYLRWLEAKIDYHNEELDGYNAAMALFDAAFEAYRNRINQRYPRRAAKIRYF
ncbi:MAG: hypothetical protein IIV61_06675 [Oscillospiraceae bacterium]|nr:hypothetical protein [Oscillospiraceae bacterium]